MLLLPMSLTSNPGHFGFRHHPLHFCHVATADSVLVVLLCLEESVAVALAASVLGSFVTLVVDSVFATPFVDTGVDDVVALVVADADYEDIVRPFVNCTCIQNNSD